MNIEQKTQVFQLPALIYMLLYNSQQSALPPFIYKHVTQIVNIDVHHSFFFKQVFRAINGFIMKTKNSFDFTEPEHILYIIMSLTLFFALHHK